MLIPIDRIERAILLIRGHRVMLSTHLALLYGVEPRVLVQAVKRNNERFPADFMSQLTPEEFSNLKSQIVISSWGGLRRATPYAFTEQGVAMLSSVLRSERAADFLPEPRVTSTNHDPRSSVRRDPAADGPRSSSPFAKGGSRGIFFFCDGASDFSEPSDREGRARCFIPMG